MDVRGYTRMFAANSTVGVGAGVHARPSLSEAGAFVRLAEIGAFHFYDAAHFVEARAHAFADAIAESFSANCALRSGKI